MALDRREFSLRRVWVASGALVLIVGIAAAAVVSTGAGVSLTAGGGVAMINLRWVAGFVERVVRPSGARLDGEVFVRLAVKLAAVGVVAGAVICQWIQPVALLVGLSLPLIPLLAEGVRSSIAEGG